MATNKSTNDDSLTGLLKALDDKIKKKIEHSLPCIVTAVESRTRVTVRAAIKIVDTEGNITSRTVLSSVPVYTAGAGDKLISFPVTVGDLGWVDATDRDISTFLQSYEETAPPTRRMHSFSDARFIPDIMTNFTVASEDATALVIQTRTGDVKIAVDDDEIRITNSDVELLVDGNAVTGIAPGGFDFNGCIIDASGNVTTASGISLGDHTHSQGVDSDNNTQQDTGAPN